MYPLVPFFYSLFILLFVFATGWLASTTLSQTNGCCPLPPSCSQLAQSTRAREVLAQLDGSASTYVRLGDVSREEGEADCAEWAYQTAVAKDDKLWGARYGLGLISIQTGHPQRAVDEL